MSPGSWRETPVLGGYHSFDDQQAGREEALDHIWILVASADFCFMLDSQALTFTNTFSVCLYTGVITRPHSKCSSMQDGISPREQLDLREIQNVF